MLRSPNLNPLPAIILRTIDQWLRQRYYRIFKTKRNAIREQRECLYHSWPTERLSVYQRQQLRKIKERLGEWGAYYYTPAQERIRWHARLMGAIHDLEYTLDGLDADETGKGGVDAQTH